MAIKDSDITVVFQGPVLEGSTGTARMIQETRKVLPGSRYILSSWIGTDVENLGVDRVILSEDPGALPGIKHKADISEVNNINRQVRSTQRGLQEATNDYAIKIRTDCALDRTHFLDSFQRFCRDGSTRIVVSSMFTIDPSMFEQMPYHVSDWFQFGRTADLQAYWSTPFMSGSDATHYNLQPYAPHSTFMDRRFRCRLAVEQYIATHYAKRFGYTVPVYHNDLRPEVLKGHRQFLGERFIVLDPWDLGLRFPKYEWAYHSSFQRLNCLLSIDWQQLYIESQGSSGEYSVFNGAVCSRRTQKRLARHIGRWVDRAGPWFLRPAVKRQVNRFLKLLDQPFSPSRSQR
jgi:hypothetical protein